MKPIQDQDPEPQESSTSEDVQDGTINKEGVEDGVDTEPKTLEKLETMEKPEEIVTLSVTEEKLGEVVVVKDVQNEFSNPLIVKMDKKKKERPRSEFVEEVINFIKGKGLEIVEEREYRAKEYNGIVRIKSELGPISFLTQAKDKKTITDVDFKKLLSTAQSIPMPAFMLYTGEISKKAKDYLIDYSSVLKAKHLG